MCSSAVGGKADVIRSVGTQGYERRTALRSHGRFPGDMRTQLRKCIRHFPTRTRQEKR